MVGTMVVIEEAMQLAAVTEAEMGAASPETKVGTIVEAMTMEVGATNAGVEEGEFAVTGEIIQQIIDIETSSEIRGTIIEEEEPLVETGEVSIFFTPQINKKRSIIKGESSRRRRTRASWVA